MKQSFRTEKLNLVVGFENEPSEKVYGIMNETKETFHFPLASKGITSKMLYSMILENEAIKEKSLKFLARVNRLAFLKSNTNPAER